MPLSQQQLTSLAGKGIDVSLIKYDDADDVLDALRTSTATLVDTRHHEHYEAGHFPGAVYAREKDQLLGLPKDQSLYLYCT